MIGIVPRQPVPVWGWIPEQNGRRTEDDEEPEC